MEVIIPVTFNFPNIGKLLSLLFVPFTAWLAGSSLELGRYPGFFVAGVLSYFAKAQTALPFLMDLFEIPIGTYLNTKDSDREIKKFFDQKNTGIEAIIEYWVLGKGIKKPAPRWSIIRNVLDWVD